MGEPPNIDTFHLSVRGTGRSVLYEASGPRHMLAVVNSTKYPALPTEGRLAATPFYITGKPCVDGILQEIQ